jgi:succinate dehydrogenase / fumarate reductase cytochrome b subunit
MGVAGAYNPTPSRDHACRRAVGNFSEELTLSWLTAALKSSVGKKCVMGGTGLFLCFFLVVHLAGNMLLWVGAEKYNHYAEALHANPAFIVAAEVFLYTAFAIHLYLAFTTNTSNDTARGQDYAVKKTKRTDRLLNNPLGWTPDSTMFATGAVVLACLILHIIDFKFPQLISAELEGLSPFNKAAYLMSQSWRQLAYLIGCLFLGVHVAHGLQSAFQSLGWNHPLFRPMIRKLSLIFAFVVVIGFGSFTVWGIGKSAVLSPDEAMEVAPDAPEDETSAAAGHPHPHPEPEQK